MTVVGLLALLVFTFGAFTYGAMLALWLREVGRGWTGTSSGASRRREAELVGGALLAVSFAWFAVNLILTLQGFGTGRDQGAELAAVGLALTYPPLIMHVTYVEVAAARLRSGVDPPGRRWRWPLWGMYPAGLIAATVAVVAGLGALPLPRRLVEAGIQNAIAYTFIGAALYALLLMSRTRPAQSSVRDGQGRRWTMRLFGFMGLLFLALFVLSWLDDPEEMATTLSLLDVTARSLPLMFMFVGTYYENRFAFFDLFVKRGLSLLVTIVLLTVAFAITLPLLRPVEASPAAPWIYAIVVLPVVGLLSWLTTSLARALDRRWLGRRFTTVEAVKRFLEGLHAATTEGDLVRQAQAGFADVFSAPVAVTLGPVAQEPPFRVVRELPIRNGDREIGRVLMGPRASEAPYFAADIALAGSLAEVLALLFDNLRLHDRRRQDDHLAREMALQASRSELKALRAQINPHFLFNALNTIAGLIHRDPLVADRTVEQLADVFRYVLRSSEHEWARLDHELDFVRAYLAVEQARFGARLQVAVRVSEQAARARVPMLAVQTLVENAVKHGVSAVRGQARVEIDAGVAGDRLVVSVADNGPGPDSEGVTSPGGASHGQVAAGGFGLDNVRRRLEGYFGSAATLDLGRDLDRAMTIATIAMPFEPHADTVAAPSLAEGRR